MRSMALTCPTSPQIILWDSSRIMKPVGSVTMLARNQVSVSRATAVRTRSSLKNQVPNSDLYINPFWFSARDLQSPCASRQLVSHGNQWIHMTEQLSGNPTSIFLSCLDSEFSLQVFEDQCEGVVCYRDENGEIICEGYDEGPRFRRKIPRAAYSYETRDAHIIDLLQQNWLQIAEDGALYKVEVGDILQEDLS